MLGPVGKKFLFATVKNTNYNRIHFILQYEPLIIWKDAALVKVSATYIRLVPAMSHRLAGSIK